MFMELQYHADREFRRMDLAEKMAERRRQSLVARRRSSPTRTRSGGWRASPALDRAKSPSKVFPNRPDGAELIALAVTAEKHEASRVAGKSSRARDRA